MAGEHTLAEEKLKVTPGCTPKPLTNVPTKCEISTPYRIQELPQTRL